MYEIAVHEAGHAVLLMHLGHVPGRISADEGGLVELPTGVSAEHRALVAAAGAEAVFQILGDDGDYMSEADLDLAEDHLRDVSLSWRHEQEYRHRVSGLVALLHAQIVTLAEALHHQPLFGRQDLAHLCRRHPDLQRYARLFPQTPAPQMTRRKPSAVQAFAGGMRRQMVSRVVSGKCNLGGVRPSQAINSILGSS